jgi:glyoxylase-like metal-dependent hydrolase (beta-lactamase superfamily II)
MSARRIYGDQMDALWGEFLAVPPDQLNALADGAVVEAGGLRFVAHDTPGHARHHLVYQVDDVAFTGDLAGIHRPGTRHLRLPTPPPEFDLAAWQSSLDRMRALRFRKLYLTHFDVVSEVDAHWQSVAELLPRYATLVRNAIATGRDRAAIIASLSDWEEARLIADGIPAADWPVYAGLGPVDMNADGLLRYWHKQAPASSQA